MVERIDTLAHNVLAAGRELYLPGIGSLFTEIFGAKRVSRTSMEQPRRIVAFTEQRRGVSLEEEIARAAGVDAEKAHEMFDEWLTQALDDEALTIKGVGVLKHGSFVMCDQFADEINKQGHERVKIKPRHNTVLYSFAAICCIFALAVAGYVVLDNRNGDDKPSKRNNVAAATENTVAETTDATEETVTTPETATAAAAATTGNEKSPATAQTANAETTPASTVPNSDEEANSILTSTPGRHYVVLGIYSTPENAFRAVKEAKQKAENLHCKVYGYGSRYMVTVYESDDRVECFAYMDSLARLFRDMWVYSKKE